MADDLTAILEHIREGAESEITHPDDECGAEAGGFCTPHGALLAVAALEAVLELADEWDAEAKKADARAQRADESGADTACTVLYTRATALNESARTLREAITRKLTGKGESDA